MNAPAVRRAPNGRLLPGSVNNPGGRPRSEIERVRELLGQHRDEFVKTLLDLVRSENEHTQLAAVQIAFDRLLGKPPVAVDQTIAKFDMGALFLDVVKNAGRPAPIDVTPPADEPALTPSAQDEADNSTDQADDAW
jgi:hypothetical protein